MNLRGKVLEFRRQLVSGELPQSKPQTALYMSWVLNFLLGMIMANATVLGGCGPFGIAVTAQAGTGISGILCAVGASMGYLLAFGFNKGIKYVAAVVLVFTTAYVCSELKIVRRKWFMPLVAGGFTLLTAVLGTLELSTRTGMLLPIFGETVLAGGCTVFFAEALSSNSRDTEASEMKHGIALIIFSSCLLVALSGVRIVGVVSLGRVAGILIVMTAAYKGGVLSGAAAGTALGVAMDMTVGGIPFYTLAYSSGGLISGLFSKRSRLVFLLVYIAVNTLATVSVWNYSQRIETLYEVFFASVVFMLLPNTLVEQVGAILRPGQLTASETGLRRFTAKRLTKMSEAFRDLYDTVDAQISADKNDEDISKVFDRAADCVCAKCRRKGECWSSGYLDTLSVFNDVVLTIRQRGMIVKEDIPQHFIEKCLRPDELVSSINAELRAQMYRRQFNNRLIENRSAAYSQYAEMSKILIDVAEELQNAYGPDALSQRRLVRFMNSIDVDADVSAFRDRSGRLRIIIESARLRLLMQDPVYLDKLSGIVGVRLCRPNTGEESEGRLLLVEAEPFSATVGIASVKKKGESVSGDRGTYFKTDSGVLCIILSDGMGSGPDAAKESIAVVRILESFLRCGIEPMVAMKMLNSMMLLKNGDTWGFATVDLMCINLFSGETEFFKYGAAPSYIRSGKTVKRVRSESLAAGLTAGEMSEPDHVKMRLKPGNIAIIASDGVLAESNDSWIRNYLVELDSSDVKTIARDTVRNALSQYGSTDDMTVLAVRLTNRD